MTFHQRLRPNAAPTLRLDAPISQGFIHATPAPPEAGRQGQFRQRARCDITRQRVRQLKERIGTARKTLPDLLTYLSHCGKVHLSNVPRFFVEVTLLVLATLCNEGCLFGSR